MDIYRSGYAIGPHLAQNQTRGLSTLPRTFCCINYFMCRFRESLILYGDFVGSFGNPDYNHLGGLLSRGGSRRVRPSTGIFLRPCRLICRFSHLRPVCLLQMLYGLLYR